MAFYPTHIIYFQMEKEFPISLYQIEILIFDDKIEVAILQTAEKKFGLEFVIHYSVIRNSKETFIIISIKIQPNVTETATIKTWGRRSRL